MSTTYKGEKVAKFFFVVGMRNPNVNEVKSLAEDITKFAKTKYPELVLSVVENHWEIQSIYGSKSYVNRSRKQWYLFRRSKGFSKIYCRNFR